mgnify:CR=1 FL=1
MERGRVPGHMGTARLLARGSSEDDVSTVPDLAGRDLGPGMKSFDVTDEQRERLHREAAEARARLLPGRDLCDGGSLPRRVDRATLSNADSYEGLPPKPSLAEPTLSDQALVLIHGPRAEEYAPPELNLPRIGAAWAAVLGLPEAIPGWKVALLLAAMKVVRAGHKPGDDSLIDAVGYCELAKQLRP